MTNERHFDDREALAESLAAAVARSLEQAVTERGRASLVVSGGTTPLPFFAALRELELPWEVVTVTLADDRWVPADHPRSNEGLVRGELLVGPAAAARFVGLVHDHAAHATPEEGVAACEGALREVPRPFDVVVLGMGADGHTASLFPAAAETPAALADDAPGLGSPGRATCVAVNPGGELEPRISLTLPALVDCHRLYLHFTGEEKWRVYRDAIGGRESLPIGEVMRRVGPRGAVYWAP